MKRLFILLILAVLALSGPSALNATDGAVTGAGHLPRVLTCAGTAVLKPARYVLACADANTSFVDITWSSWGQTAATARGTFVQNNCAPTCAEGTFVRYPATLSLSVPTTTKYGRLFSVIGYRYLVSASTTLPLMPLSAVQVPGARARCGSDPTLAARFVIPPPPFVVRDVTVTRRALPQGEPASNGSKYIRLYEVRFFVVKGNAVLPSGHRFTQFAYVSRQVASAPWCFFRGGSGP